MWVEDEARFLGEEFTKFTNVARDEHRLEQVHTFLRWFFSPTIGFMPSVGKMARFAWLMVTNGGRDLLGCWIGVPR